MTGNQASGNQSGHVDGISGGVAERSEGGSPSGGPSRGDGAHRYSAGLAHEIESRWQDAWDRDGTYAAPNPGEPGFDGSRPKTFVLDMFPYPSGVGLHVGHPLGYIATDIYARYLRMTGRNVVYSMGFDAFGLPAEQYAVQTGTHPRLTTERNIATMRAQLRRLGLSHDRRRSVSTTDPAYYKWTQWIFLQIYHSWYDAEQGRARPIAELQRELERGARRAHDGRAWGDLSPDERREELDRHRLAYLAEVPVNWCPRLGTVLANEEVTADGRSERGNFPVFKRPMKQWMLRITAYAERLARDLEPLDWPEPIKLMQRNWIGRSEGAGVEFAIEGSGERVRVFTTRPDTLLGATYLVLSPEHPLVDRIVAGSWDGAARAGGGGPREVPGAWKGRFPGAPEHGAGTPAGAVAAYRAWAASRSDVQRSEAKEKTGVFTGAWAINPGDGRRVPVFIADYVLMGYGTGAIMAVPAHDQRDFEFARALSLPIRDVVYPRAVLAMRVFAQQAYAGREPSPDWRTELADFLGVVAGAPADESLETLLDAMRAGGRRHDRDEATPGVEIDAPGALGRQRGAVRAVWLETIEELELKSFHDLAHRFRDAGYFDALGEAYAGPGTAVNSSVDGGVSLNGLHTPEAKRAMTEWLERAGHGRGAVTYKLRDWLFSRQRYWGEPFPIVFDERGVAHALPESMLPVELPDLDNFQPESSEDPDAPPRPPLARAARWATPTLDLGGGPARYTRELNTMPNWAGSCWYYLRYLDPENARALCGAEAERYWMGGVAPGAGGAGNTPARFGGVDLYVGGVEHAVLHLLYARFWHKVLFDLGHVSTPEPFQRLFNQGYIQAYAYADERGVYVEASGVVDEHGTPAGQVQDKPGPFFFEGRPVRREYGKMGKSLKNAVAPDDVCAEFGCDTLRVYEMAMGPLEASKPWNPRDIAGSYRFLQRVWRNLIDEQTGAPRVDGGACEPATRRLMHKTILGVRRDIEGLSFNTAVSKLIEFNNHLSGLERVPREAGEALALLLAPLAPHLSSELWARLGHATHAVLEAFPVGDPALAADDTVEVPVQVMGKVRSKITLAAGADEKAHESAALADPRVQELLVGKTVRKVVVVPGRMVNIVAN